MFPAGLVSVKQAGWSMCTSKQPGSVMVVKPVLLPKKVTADPMASTGQVEDA